MRLLSLWFAHLSTDRLARAAPEQTARPRVIADSENGALRLVAVDQDAQMLGLAPGMSLADARAYAPELDVAFADRHGDMKMLERIARWARRYTPHVALDGNDGLMLDITGAAHLVGGEARLRRDVLDRLAKLGFAARAAIAATPGAAWAIARFGAATMRATDADAIVASDPTQIRRALDALPIAALRLAPNLVETLDRLGLRRIGDLHDLPRHGLAARFGSIINDRLDRTLGRAAEPISPLPLAPAWMVQLAFAEPVSTPEDLARIVDRLLAQICAQLALAEFGARRLELSCHRIDGRHESCAIATSSPVRDPRRLARLFAEKLTTIDPGLGIETMTMTATLVEAFSAAQLTLTPAARAAIDSFGPPDAIDLSPFIDQITNRLGADAIVRLAIDQRHIPELTQIPLPALQPSGSPASPGTIESWRSPWTRAPTRPLRLLPIPDPVEVTAELPEGPPLTFRWRRILHRVRSADGPERLAPEWWIIFEQRHARRNSAQHRPLQSARTRDYYRIEDEDGRRFWLFRDGPWSAPAPPHWFMHGIFA